MAVFMDTHTLEGRVAAADVAADIDNPLLQSLL
jgi:hypothetical protein